MRKAICQRKSFKDNNGADFYRNHKEFICHSDRRVFEEWRNPFLMPDYFVYIIASDSGTLHIGVTSNLSHRVSEHKEGIVDGFSKRYGCKRLIYYEQTTDIYSAISREKQLKN